MAPTSLSKSELPAQEAQALEANLTQISLRLLARRHMLATAESCTGGMIAAACTDLSGSSQWFERGFVTYSNEAKAEMLAVPPGLIEEHGAVSEPVARAMAEGALARSGCGLTLAVTGIAGPGGGTAEKPVGLVHLATAVPGLLLHRRAIFPGDRTAVRLATVAAALALALELVEAG